jgi:hypothetical protein
MKRTLFVPIFAALAAIHANNAMAQQVSIKPGLWQIDMAMEDDTKRSPLGDFVQQLQASTLTDEDRKELAKSTAELAAKGAELNTDGLRQKECLTREQIARSEIIGGEAPATCTVASSPTADGVTMKMTCPDPTMNHEIRLKYQGEEAFAMEMVTATPGLDGTPITLKGSGKWLSSNCGTVKPTSSRE